MVCLEDRVRVSKVLLSGEVIDFSRGRVLASACGCVADWWLQDEDPRPRWLRIPGLRPADHWPVWRFLVEVPGAGDRPPDSFSRYFLLGIDSETGELRSVEELEYTGALEAYQRLFTKWVDWPEAFPAIDP